MKASGPVFVLASFALGVVALLGARSQAHEEDWRKLADREPIVRAPALLGGPFNGLRGAAEFDSQGVDLLAWLPLTEFGDPENGADCWGYVSPSGREYAILGTSSGTEFIDLSDPANPVHIASIPGAESLWRDIKVKGHHAYSVNEDSGGVQVIDLSQIDQGAVTLVTSVTEGGLQTVHNVAINPESDTLYLAGSNIGNGSLLAMDISDPANPTIVGRWQQQGARYAHDAQVVTWRSGPLAGREIAFSFDGGNGLHVLDVTVKSDIRLIGVSRYADLRYCHQGWLSPDHTRLYVNDELDERYAPNVTTTLTRVFDVTDPENPTLIDTFTNGLGAIDHNLYTKDDLVFEANYTTGLRVFRARDDGTHDEVAFIDTHPNDDDPTFNGAWSVYPYLPSGTLIISDIERGLFVTRLVEDRFAPSLRLADAPEIVTPSGSRMVTVEVIPGGPAIDASRVTLHARIGEGPFLSYPMRPVEDDGGADRFVVELPEGECAEVVEYLITAIDEGGGVARLPINAADTLSVRIASEFQQVGTWTMEAEDDGWRVEERFSTAREGAWERAVPAPGPNQPFEDVSEPGLSAWVTGPGPTDNAFDRDVDDGSTTLISPSIDLSAFEAGDDAVKIAYHRWYSQVVESRDRADTFRVEVSRNGDRWFEVESLGVEHPDTGAGWVRHEFAPLTIIDPGPNVQLRFVVDDIGGDDGIEAGVDDVSVFVLRCEEPVPPCPADWNADDAANPQDFFDFLNDYFSGAGPRGTGDFNADGFTNAQDFFDFLNAYYEACP